MIFPLNFDIRIVTIGDELSNDIINGETWKKNGSFSSSNCLFANETLFLNDQVLVDALRAEAMAADRSLTFIDEVEAEWAN